MTALLSAASRKKQRVVEKFTTILFWNRLRARKNAGHHCRLQPNFEVRHNNARGIDSRQCLDDRGQRGSGAAIRRIEGADSDRELGKRWCTMQDGPRGHQIDDRPRQFALQLIDIDGGIEQERCLSGNLKWIKRKIRLQPMRQGS